MSQQLLWCAVRKGILFPENYDYSTLALSKKDTEGYVKRDDLERPWRAQENPVIRYARLKIEEIKDK